MLVRKLKKQTIAILLVTGSQLSACGTSNTSDQRSSSLNDAAQTSTAIPDEKTDEKTDKKVENSETIDAQYKAPAESSLAANVNSNWFSGWDDLIKREGSQMGDLPYSVTPKTIKATPMKNPTRVKLYDYWLKATGYTTMWGQALQYYGNKKYRSDGIRWDTPTTWVPTMVGGGSSGGHMTLRTQFGQVIPSYQNGAKPYSNQTDWIFHINKSTGAIMEIFDRQHFGIDGNGLYYPHFSEVVATGYGNALYWAPYHTVPVGGTYQFKGPTNFVGNNGQKHTGYSAVQVVNRYDTFTVPPSRNKQRDCPAAVFKDVIAVRHQQFWYDPSTGKSRADYIMVYMAKDIGWIYQLIAHTELDSAGRDLTPANQRHFLHLSPVGYINQNNWKRMCPDQFRDFAKKVKR